jgi:hypothetical protein
MLCCYLNVFVFVYINECIDVNTALKNAFKYMSFLGRIHQFPRNFLRWQAPGLNVIKLFGNLPPFHGHTVILCYKATLPW